MPRLTQAMIFAPVFRAAFGALACLLVANCEPGNAPPLLGATPGTNTLPPGVNGGNSVPCPPGSPPPARQPNDGGLAVVHADAAQVDAGPTDAASEQSQAPVMPIGLAAAYSGKFPIGAAISAVHLAQAKNILQSDFNHLTAENAMKFASVQPSEGAFTFDDADEIADFARQTGKPLTGHTLIWHRQSPSWLFSDLTPEDSESIEKLKQRMRSHIEAMVERYADIVDNWDVVNEAISDTSGKSYRDAEEGSDWYRIFGSEEYVYWAYKFTYDALEANSSGSAQGKLYYNDYNETLKVDRIITMLDAIRGRGVPVDGVGLQGHYRVGWPSVADLRTTIQKYAAAGYSVKISELDVSVYDDYSSGAFKAASEVECTQTVADRQAEYYASLFALFRELTDQITSVTFWGISDDRTWLDSEPVSGRNDYPLLWNDDHEPKAAYYAVLP